MQKGKSFINKGAVVVEDHAKLKNGLSNKEKMWVIRNHPYIHATLIISVLNVTVGIQIRASDVYRRITVS